MPLAPDVLPWLARVFSSDGTVVGAGFLVDDRYMLTCAHVVLAALGLGPRAPLPDGEVSVAVEFPVADGGPCTARVVREGWVPVAPDGRGDVAVLELSATAPAATEPARLRRSTTLRDHPFSTHGFPKGEPWGVSAVGVLRGREGPGWQWVRVEDTKEVGRPVERGFSGSPVWDDRLGGVVAMVVAQDRRKETKGAYAIPIAVLDEAWGPLVSVSARVQVNAAELRTHWEPRARGLERLTPDAGSYFTGRVAVMRELVSWLNAPIGEHAGPNAWKGRIVTGDPGSGKSAVLSRLVLTADAQLRRRLPHLDATNGTVSPPGSVDVAVHARGKTLADVVDVLAAAADVPASDPEALVAGLLQRGTRLTLVVDALDEASGGGQDIARRLLRPLAADGGPHGIRVLVGARGPLLTALGTSAFLVLHVDEPPWLEREDLAEYVRRLLLADEPSAATPYQGRLNLAGEVAQEVARRAHPIFLIAQLVGRALTRDPQPVDVTRKGWADQFPATVGEAMDDYLARFADQETRARDLLRPLAYAVGAGLPQCPLWVDLANALSLRRTYTVRGSRLAARQRRRLPRRNPFRRERGLRRWSACGRGGVPAVPPSPQRPPAADRRGAPAAGPHR